MKPELGARKCVIPSCANESATDSVMCPECRTELLDVAHVVGRPKARSGAGQGAPGELHDGANVQAQRPLLRQPIIGISRQVQAHMLAGEPAKTRQTSPSLAPHADAGASLSQPADKPRRNCRKRIPRIERTCPCGKVMLVPVHGWMAKRKYCDEKCRSRYFKPKPRGPKYAFDEKADELIRDLYRNSAGMSSRKRPVAALAERLGLPTWKVTRRAIQLGVLERTRKEPNWCEAELAILKERAHQSFSAIRRHLKAAGYSRSETGIGLKLKRLGGVRRLKRGYSCREAAGLFGIEPGSLAGWIRDGYLRAEMRGTKRTTVQGGDIYFIRPDDLRTFVRDHVSLVDFRKVDKYWLVEMLAGSDG